MRRRESKDGTYRERERERARREKDETRETVRIGRNPWRGREMRPRRVREEGDDAEWRGGEGELVKEKGKMVRERGIRPWKKNEMGRPIQK